MAGFVSHPPAAPPPRRPDRVQTHVYQWLCKVSNTSLAHLDSGNPGSIRAAAKRAFAYP